MRAASDPFPAAVGACRCGHSRQQRLIRGAHAGRGAGAGRRRITVARVADRPRCAHPCPPASETAPCLLYAAAMGAERVESDLLRALGTWSLASIAVGGALWPMSRDRAALRSFARQQVSWGAIDGALAVAGVLRGRPTEAAKLRRLLRINAAFDVGYVMFGAALIWQRDRVGAPNWYSADQAVGDGLGIIVQGGFLLVLDASQAARLKPTSDPGAAGEDRYGGGEEDQ